MSVRLSVRVGAPPLPAGILQGTDFTYIGSFKLPGNGDVLYRSSGTFAIRRGTDGSGPLTFIISGQAHEVSGWQAFPLYREVSYPGEDLSSPPTASIVKDYTGVSDYLTHALLVPSDDCGVANVNGPLTWGLHYDQTTNLLWASYQTCYNDSQNPILITQTLNSDGTITAYGPWASTAASGKTGGFIQPIPAAAQASVGGHTIFVGSPPHVQNDVTGFGGQVWIGDLVPKTTTPDTPGSGTHAISLTPVLDYDITDPQPRNVSALKLTNWNCTANPSDPACGGNPYSSGLGGTIMDAAPFFGGSFPGGSYLLDWQSTGEWIVTPSKRGFCQFGVLADTIPGHVYESGDGTCHLWYGPGTDFYGQIDATHPATGPGAGTLAFVYWIWDPNDLVNVYNGGSTPTTPLPTETGLWTALPGASGLPGGYDGTGYDGKYIFGQTQYDAVSGKLFVSLKNIDTAFSGPIPRIFVFQVNQS